MEQLLTVKDIAQVLNKAIKTIYAYVEQGVFPEEIIIRIANTIRMKRGDLDKWINSKCGRR